MPTDSGWMERWLSPPRFAPYRQEAHGDDALALALYEWNACLGSAIMHDLAHVEVALRNVYDRVLDGELGLSRHWTTRGREVFAPVVRVRREGSGKREVDVNEKPRAALARAIREAGGDHAPSGKVIAQLSFGFWRYLTSAAHETTVWRPALHRAFPQGTRRADVDSRIVRLHGLRNRVAHHEPLLGWDIEARQADLIHVSELIDPLVAAYISAHSTVMAVFVERPL